MEDHNGIDNSTQKLLTAEESKIKELQDRLTPEFLQTLHDTATCVGWDVDAIEITKFLEIVYAMAGRPNEFKPLDL